MGKFASRDPTMLLGTSLCEDLGLDPKQVKSVAFRACINEAPVVTVEFYPNKEGQISVLRQFKITAAEMTPPSGGDER